MKDTVIDDIVSRLNDLKGFDDFYFILIALVLAFGFLQTSGTIMDTERPAVSVISPSMCPAIQVGDILVVKGSNYEDIQVDDVIVYDVPDRVEMSVDNKDYILEGEGSNVSTEFGLLKLRDVIPAEDRRSDGVVLELNDQTLSYQGDKVLREGDQYPIDGKTLEIDYATSLPYENTPIVHRVVKKSDNSFETMGDANAGQIEFEKNISTDQIYGKKIFKIPRLGLLKLVVMDLIGYQGDEPLVLDATPSC